MLIQFSMLADFLIKGILWMHVVVRRYFSYEHFYVIYCKFWELDSDHDFLIDKDDLLRYGNHALTYRIVERIFSQVFATFSPIELNMPLICPVTFGTIVMKLTFIYDIFGQYF
jgi:hypothetical protein